MRLKLTRIVEFIEFLNHNITDSNYATELTKSKIEIQEKYIEDSKNNRDTILSEKTNLISTNEEEIFANKKKEEELQQSTDTFLEAMKGEDKVTDKRDKLKDIQFSLKDKHNRNTSLIKFFEENDDCPTCEQHIDEEFKCKSIDEKLLEVRELETGLHKLSDEMDKVNKKVKDFKWSNTEWLKSLKSTKKSYIDEMTKLADNKLPMHPMDVSLSIQENLDDDTFVVFDGGDYCHFSRATVPIENYLRSLYVSSFGMIGVGLPYAIGAKAALPDKKVILVVGDGSLGFHVPEIDTSIRHNLPVTVVVGNNSLWGIDYWIQKGLYDRDVWTKLDQTNYELVAKGFGAEGKFVDNPSMLKDEIKNSLKSDKITVLNTVVRKISSPVADAAVTRKLGTHG